MLYLQKSYLIAALGIFMTEVLIALYVHDAIIRPWGGDFLVVILLYCLVKGVTTLKVRTAAVAVLLFSYVIEALQYIQIVRLLGLENNAVATTVIGTSFSWSDMLAYTLGIVFVLVVEKMNERFRNI